jgi:hypothetical protein
VPLVHDHACTSSDEKKETSPRGGEGSSPGTISQICSSQIKWSSDKAVMQIHSSASISYYNIYKSITVEAWLPPGQA